MQLTPCLGGYFIKILASIIEHLTKCPTLYLSLVLFDSLVLMLQMREMRLREGTELVPGHIRWRWFQRMQSWPIIFTLTTLGLDWLFTLPGMLFPTGFWWISLTLLFQFCSREIRCCLSLPCVYSSSYLLPLILLPCILYILQNFLTTENTIFVFVFCLASPHPPW